MELFVDTISTWPKEWVVPEETKTIRLGDDDTSKIEIPYIIKDRVLLKEGVANGTFYPGEEIEPLVEILNEKPNAEDVLGRNRTSIFWDHDDACKNWLGEIKNFRWDPEAKALLGDIYLVDEDAAKKTHYQLEEDMSRWGISPRIRIDDKDGRATDIQPVTFALVMDPAGGPKLMLAREKFDCECIECGWKITSETHCKDLKCKECEGQMQEIEKSESGTSEETQNEEPCTAWVCEKCGYSEAVEKDEEKEKTKACPKCEGEMVQKKEEKGSIEELYTDLELEPEEKKMEFDIGTRVTEDLSKWAEEFGLTPKELSEFSEEQFELLRGVPTETTENLQETGKKTSEKEADKKLVEDEIEPVRKKLETFAPLLKIDLDEHIVKMVVLEPEVADNYGHLVSEEEIRNAMHMWMEHYRNCEVMHRDRAGNLFPLEDRILKPEDEVWGQGYDKEFAILECYQAPMDYFEEDQVVRKGTWILTLRIKDEKIWQKIKNKELTGASIGGHSTLTEAVA